MRVIDANALYRNIKNSDLLPHERIEFMKMVREAPTIEAEPVWHGRWDDIPNTYMSVSGKDGSYSGSATSCSACQEVNPNAFKTNYCPNCGAKMYKEEEEC